MKMPRDYMPVDREDFREEGGAPSSPAPRLDIQPIRARGASIDPFRETNPALSPDARIPDTILREQADRLRARERLTLTELGRFRLISTEDLARHAYGGHRQEMEQDVRNLLRQGLIQREALEGSDGTTRQMLTLTTQGHRLLRANRLVGDSESIDHIPFKPKEAVHDADLYRLYQKGAARVEAEGGTNLRIVFDWELDKALKRDFAAGDAETREQIASRYGLRMVGEKIPVPDLRIEYQTPEEELAHVDLELVTEHYRPGQLAEKARAGFSLYAPRSEAERLRGVLKRQGLTTEILSL
jgi:hypothetical protein